MNESIPFKQTTWFILLLPSVLILFFGLMVLAPGEFDKWHDSYEAHIILEKLVPSDVSSIELGHQLIDGTGNINSIVTALNKNTHSYPFGAFKFALPTRSIRLTLNLKDGRKLSCPVLKYYEQPGDAFLVFSRFTQRELQIRGLADILDNAGVHLPEGGLHLRISENNGKILEDILLSNTSKRAPRHTLYNIQRSPLLIAPTENSQLTFIAESCVLALIVVYGISFALSLTRMPNRQKLRNMLIWGCSIVTLLLAFAWLVWSNFGIAVFHNGAYDQYQALKTAFVKGKCKTLCGKLTDVRYVVEEHGAVYLRMIEVDGHRFLFSNSRSDQALYDADSWEGWAPEQLQAGVSLCVWYATIDGWNTPPEHVARVDVQ